MDALFGLVGFLGVIIFLVILIVNTIRKKPKKKALKGLIICFVLFVIGLAMPTSNDNNVETANKIEEAKTEPTQEEKKFELSDSDKELLKGVYADFSDNQIARFNEIEDKYIELDEGLRADIKVEVDRLSSERSILEEVKKAEEEARAEEERIKTEKEAEEKARAEKEKYNTGITTKDMARDKNGLEGSFVKFSGRVVQVINGKISTQYRMAVNDDYDQIIFIEIANIELESNILEDDYITIEGVSIGNISYKTVLGNEQTIPGVAVHNFYY